jgi:holo-[acyl-carrier protein] synthase
MSSFLGYRIVGVGTEIVECLRIARLIERHGETFLRRAYTPAEIKFCSSRARATQHYTAVWAGKEATLKALSVKLGNGISLRDIELRTPEGELQTKVCLGGKLRDISAKQRIYEIKISTSICRNYASALAVALAE